MDQELKDLLQELISDPSARAKREADFTRDVKAGKDLHEMRLQELKHLKLLATQQKKKLKNHKEIDDQIDEQIKSTEKLIKTQNQFAAQMRTARDAVVGLAGAAYKGEGSFSAFSDNLKSMGSVGKSIGFLGERLDVNVETFRQLTQVGASFGQSIVEMRQAAGTARLPLDDFAKLVGENSKALAAMYGTSTAGAKAVAGLTDDLRRLGNEQLAPLGFTVEEQNEAMIVNLEMLRRTGLLEGMTSGQRVQSSIAFAKQLDLLAKATGLQRQDIVSGIQSAQSNSRLQAALAGPLKGMAGDVLGLSSSIQGMAPSMTEGLNDLLAAQGRPITEAAQQLNIAFGNQLGPIIRDFTTGVIDQQTALNRIINASGNSVDKFGKIAQTGALEVLNPFFADLVSLSERSINLAKAQEEQEKAASPLTQQLTTFQDAVKTLSSQFQSIETGLLASFGPALGGLVNFTTGFMDKFGGIATALASNPALTGAAIGTVLAGMAFFDIAKQIMITTTGVAAGIRMAGGMGGMFGGVGKAAKFGLTRALPAVGAAVGVGSSAMMLGSEDEQIRRQGKYGLGGAAAGAATGALIGSVVPVIGTLIGGLIGAGLGAMAGQSIGAPEDQRTLGTIGATGSMFEPASKMLHVEKGERVLNHAETQNYNAMETHLSSLVSETQASNKALTDSVETLNKLLYSNELIRKASQDQVRITRSASTGALVA
jgi:hypothetical protein